MQINGTILIYNDITVGRVENMRFNIDETSATPLYKQIVGEVCRGIKSAALQHGQKLPTVRELADELGIARGTIKHAYSELEHLGIIEMTQGRGTFITDVAQNQTPSKKVQAMQAIDTMLDELEGLSFSLREVEIFLNLKLRERSGETDTLQLGAIGGSREELYAICEALSKHGGMRVTRLLLDDVMRSPHGIDGGIDLIVVENSKKEELRLAVPDFSRVSGIAMQAAQDTVAQIARLDPNAKVGILALDMDYQYVMQAACTCIMGAASPLPCSLISDAISVQRSMADCEVLIIPDGYNTLCAKEQIDMLAQYEENGGRIINFKRIPDMGSEMEIKKRIDQARKILKDENPY